MDDDDGTADHIANAVADSGPDSQTTTRRGVLKVAGVAGVGVVGIGIGATALNGGSGAGTEGGGDKGGTGASEPTQTERTTSTPQPTESQFAYREDGVGLYDDLRWQESEFGNLSIAGTAVNVTGSTLSYVQITVAFLDATGAQLETSLDNTNNLAAGQEWRYSAMYPGMDTSEVDDARVTGIDAY